jgi:hypothetical protein
MKNTLLFTVLFFSLLGFSSFCNFLRAQEKFEEYFEKECLRIDFSLVGNATHEEFILEQLKKQPHWAGSRKFPVNADFEMGTYRFSIYDSASNLKLYSQGFCSLFNEWQTTLEAKLERRSYYHVNLMPFPKKTIKYVLDKRAYSDGKFYPVTELYINPKNYFILNEKPKPIKFTQIQGNSNNSQKIDIAFIAEGYTKKEMAKFKNDVKKTWDYISSVSPFNEYKDVFNIYAVESESEDSGTDIPGKNIYKNTVLNSMFYTFDTPRYLTTKDIKAVYDIAAVLPSEHLFILINSTEYGGGGFYNYYAATTVNHAYSLKVAVHEFGHSFAGLADEYYTSDVAYDGFYNLLLEPWEPNITTLVAFKNKWSDMLTEGISIPTERTIEFKNNIGVFEGGGYAAKGIYSPFQDCRMKSNNTDEFCLVCKKSIRKVIESSVGK